MTSTIPAWLEEQIRITTGAAPGARNVRPSRCRDCRARILEGLDDDQAAFHVRVDATPLSPAGEALAWLAGDATYALRSHGPRSWRLHRRDRWQIGGTPAGTLDGPMTFDVVADHRCNGPQLPHLPSVHRPAPSAAHIDQPPF